MTGRRWTPAPAGELLAAALDHAARGWHVFPLVPGTKRPAVAGWPDRATTDPDRIEAVWSHGAYGIGIATGPSRLVVVDLDHKPDLDGLTAWTTLTTGQPAAGQHTDGQPAAGGPVPATWTVRTPTGGRHLYFIRPATAHGGRPALGELRNTQSLLAPGIDTRALGGYVVAPPTTLPAGRYAVTDTTPPAPLPAWLAVALSPRQIPTGPAPTPLAARQSAGGAAEGDERTRAYLAAAISAETRRVADAQPGQRNHALFCAAVALGQLVAGGALPEPNVRHVLTGAAGNHIRDRAYTARTADATITSGLRAGARRPRTLDGASRDEDHRTSAPTGTTAPATRSTPDTAA